MGLSPEEFSPGRQIERDGETLEVLDLVSGASGSQFIVVTSEDAGGMCALLPVARLRDEESEFSAVDEEERQARARQAEEDRQAQEEREREEFNQWRAERGGGQEPQPQA